MGVAVIESAGIKDIQAVVEVARDTGRGGQKLKFVDLGDLVRGSPGQH